MKPLALILFCCSGGDTVGLERAGFRCVGVDHKPSNYWSGEGELHQADLSTASAVAGVVEAFKPDFVAASPPCQANSVATATHARAKHPNLIASTREGLIRAGVPAWMENVPPIPAARWPEIVRPDVVLCGSMFHATWGLRRHRHFELLGWHTMSPEHRWCVFGPAEDTLYTDPLGVQAVVGGSDARRVAVAVAVAGHGPPDAAQSRKYRERRAVESVHDGMPGSNSVRSRERRTRDGRREVVTVTGDGQGQRGRGTRRATTTIAGNQGEGPGQWCGQNKAGPECINWRRAMGWLDGPKHRDSLAQAIPPAYAEWLGRRFLETRAAR